MGKNKFDDTQFNTIPREVLPPQGLFQIQGWIRYDWGKTIAMMGWMQFWSYLLIRNYSFP
jgi:hypothetical protein